MIIQVTNQDGDHVGLYETTRTDEGQVLEDVEKCFSMAKEIASMDSGVDEQDAADVYLEERNIIRTFAENVFVEL